MDTSDYPSLPNLARMHSRLAADSRRVEEIVLAQMDAVERLFYATTAEDWKGVALASQMLAEQDVSRVGDDVVNQAKNVYQELCHTTSKLRRPKHLEKLLTACRELRRKAR